MTKDNNQAATIGFEDQLWRAADASRSTADAAEYKRGNLGGCDFSARTTRLCGSYPAMV